LRTSDVIPLYVRLGDWVGKLVVVLTLGGIALLVSVVSNHDSRRVSTWAGRSPISSRSEPTVQSSFAKLPAHPRILPSDCSGRWKP